MDNLQRAKNSVYRMQLELRNDLLTPERLNGHLQQLETLLDREMGLPPRDVAFDMLRDRAAFSAAAAPPRKPVFTVIDGDRA